MTESVTITYILRGTVVNETVKGRRAVVDIASDKRGTVTVYDRKGRKRRVIGYALLERFEWRRRG